MQNKDENLIEMFFAFIGMLGSIAAIYTIFIMLFY